MITSLVWSLATKVADIVCGVWDCICRKRTQTQSTLIPRYQRKYWYNNGYGYEPIKDTPSSSSAKQQRQYKDSITYTSRPTDKNNYYDQHGQKKSATSSSTILNPTRDNNKDGAIQYSAGRCRHPIITTDLHYYDIVIPRPIQTDPFILSENKSPTFKNSPPPTPVALDKKNSAPLKAHVQAKTKRNETSRQRRLRRKRKKDNEIVINPIVFNDNDIKYTAMRTQAHEALLLKITSRKKSDEAFKNGNKKQGRDLLAKSRVHHTEMMKLNQKAANHKFNETNKGRPSNIVDLHGLFVNEAREKVKAAIQRCKTEKKREMILIVGNGNHSHDKVSKLKPAMMEYVGSLKLHCVPNKPNSGCLLVQLGEPSLISL